MADVQRDYVFGWLLAGLFAENPHARRVRRLMPGSRTTGFLFGSSAERLAELILGSFAFVTPVPHQVDVGHDFHCVLHRPAADRRTLRAGPAFSAQVKSGEVPPYEAGPRRSG